MTTRHVSCFNGQVPTFDPNHRWQDHYENAAERLFGIEPGECVTPEQDEVCVADADDRLAADLAEEN